MALIERVSITPGQDQNVTLPASPDVASVLVDNPSTSWVYFSQLDRWVPPQSLQVVMRWAPTGAQAPTPIRVRTSLTPAGYAAITPSSIEPVRISFFDDTKAESPGQNIGMLVNGNVAITGTAQVSISGTPTVQFAAGQSVAITGTPTIQFAAGQQVTISNASIAVANVTGGSLAVNGPSTSLGTVGGTWQGTTHTYTGIFTIPAGAHTLLLTTDGGSTRIPNGAALGNISSIRVTGVTSLATYLDTTQVPYSLAVSAGIPIGAVFYCPVSQYEQVTVSVTVGSPVGSPLRWNTCDVTALTDGLAVQTIGSSDVLDRAARALGVVSLTGAADVSDRAARALGAISAAAGATFDVSDRPARNVGNVWKAAGDLLSQPTACAIADISLAANTNAQIGATPTAQQSIYLHGLHVDIASGSSSQRCEFQDSAGVSYAAWDMQNAAPHHFDFHGLQIPAGRSVRIANTTPGAQTVFMKVTLIYGLG